MFNFYLVYSEEHIGQSNQASHELQVVYKRLRKAYYTCGFISILIFGLCVSFGLTYLWNRSHYLFIGIRIILPPCAGVLTIKESSTYSPHRQIGVKPISWSNSSSSENKKSLEVSKSSKMVKKSILSRSISSKAVHVIK